MPKVRFFYDCSVSGCQVDEELEFGELPSDEELTVMAHDQAHDWFGVEGWYEVLEDA